MADSREARRGALEIFLGATPGCRENLSNGTSGALQARCRRVKRVAVQSGV